ncbi:MAG: HAD hydrolase family protein [Elusimicrobia bacterium]|nr:HAD hydrolase family protein [Elusimicrobiota bacterium]
MKKRSDQAAGKTGRGLNFVLDVDGVLSTGQFLYSADGKMYKVFGPHDADGLALLRGRIGILFITADRRGFPISKKRVEDMGYEIELVPGRERYRLVGDRFGLDNLIFMGDGIFDAQLLKDCKFGIAPAGARPEALKAADFITASRAGEGAVCDACVEIAARFLGGK